MASIMRSMTVHLTIGEFSKMTYLSVKALRHYHDVGLLEPAEIDPSTGYRHYTADQVATAQAIRRFRDLDMPLDQVRAVLQAPDLTTRNEAILDHLESMQQQLERTQHTVASLQALLTSPSAPRSGLVSHPARHHRPRRATRPSPSTTRPRGSTGSTRSSTGRSTAPASRRRARRRAVPRRLLH